MVNGPLIVKKTGRPVEQGSLCAGPGSHLAQYVPPGNAESASAAIRRKSQDHLFAYSRFGNSRSDSFNDAAGLVSENDGRWAAPHAAKKMNVAPAYARSQQAD